jgi:hypothetical protein
VREFRLFAGVVALALLPGIGAAYADLVVPISFFADGTLLEGNLSNGTSFTVSLFDTGNPVTLSTVPITSIGSITFPQPFSLIDPSLVFHGYDANGNPLFDYAGALVQSVTPQVTADDVYLELGNAETPPFLAVIGIKEVAPAFVENPETQAVLIQRRKDPDLNDQDTIHDPQFYLTVGSPSLGGDIPALTPDPSLVPEPSSMPLLVAAVFLALATSRRRNSCRLLRNAGVKHQRSS